MPSFQVQVPTSASGGYCLIQAGWTPPGLAQLQTCLVILPTQNLFPMGTDKILHRAKSLPGLLAKRHRA